MSSANRVPRPTTRSKVVSLCRWDRLSPTTVKAWADLVERDPRFENPFWHPTLIGAFARFRPNVEIATVHHADGTWAGVLPFERVGESMAIPVGDSFSDYHGFIGGHVDSMTARELQNILRQAGIRSMRFHHAPMDQAAFAGTACFQESSPIVDLTEGIESYREDLKARGSKYWKRMGQRSRKLSRELGPLSLRETTDLPTYDTMRTWKQLRCECQGRSNTYEQRWSVDLFRHLLHESEQQDGDNPVKTSLVTLKAGTTDVATAFVVKSRSVAHVWKIATSPEHTNYSLALLLLHAMIRDAEKLGIRKIDLARGEDRYKTTLQNRQIVVGEGWTDGSGLLAQTRRIWLTSKRRLRGTRLERPSRDLVRWMKRRINVC